MVQISDDMQIDFDTEIDFFKPDVLKVLDMMVPGEPSINCQDYDLGQANAKYTSRNLQLLYQPAPFKNPLTTEPAPSGTIGGLTNNVDNCINNSIIFLTYTNDGYRKFYNQAWTLVSMSPLNTNSRDALLPKLAAQANLPNLTFGQLDLFHNTTFTFRVSFTSFTGRTTATADYTFSTAAKLKPLVCESNSLARRAQKFSPYFCYFPSTEIVSRILFPSPY